MNNDFSQHQQERLKELRGMANAPEEIRTQQRKEIVKSLQEAGILDENENLAKEYRVPERGIVMEKNKKINQIIVRLTEDEKKFLLDRAEEEDRTISAIVKAALRERYPDFGRN